MLNNARKRGSERCSPILQHLLILRTQQHCIQETTGIDNGQNPYTQVRLDTCQADREVATEKWYFPSF